LADRDLVFQDFQVVLVPGMRLYCFPRASARSVLRCARTRFCEQRRLAPLSADAGAELRAVGRANVSRLASRVSARRSTATRSKIWCERSAHAREATQPHAQDGTTPKSRNTVLDARSRTSGATRRCPQTLVRAKRSTLRAEARAKQLSRMPGNTSSSLTLARSDHDLRMRLGAQKLTEQAHAFHGLERGRPRATVRACANESLKTAREAPRVHLRRPFSRELVSGPPRGVRLTRAGEG